MAGIGIVFNVALLGALPLKYSDFFIQNFNSLFGKNFATPENTGATEESATPPTFLQVAFLVDSYRGKVRENGLLLRALRGLLSENHPGAPSPSRAEIVPQLNGPGGRGSIPATSRGASVFSSGW